MKFCAFPSWIWYQFYSESYIRSTKYHFQSSYSINKAEVSNSYHFIQNAQWKVQNPYTLRKFLAISPQNAPYVDCMNDDLDSFCRNDCFLIFFIGKTTINSIFWKKLLIFEPIFFSVVGNFPAIHSWDSIGW